MEVITDIKTTITIDLFARVLRAEPSDFDSSLLDYNNYGKPTNRFGWLPVQMLLGPVWENKTIESFLGGQDPRDGSLSRPSHEFARNVPLSHQEPASTCKDACYMDWRTRTIISND